VGLTVIHSEKENNRRQPMKWNKTLIAVAIIGVIGTAFNGALAFRAETTQAESSKELSQIQLIIVTLTEQLKVAREREEAYLAKLILQANSIMDLTSQVKDKTTQAELLAEVLESLPFPAWIKVRGKDGIFRIVTINEQFTVDYGMTKREMIGYSDYDLYPPDLAQIYQEGDIAVYSNYKPYRSDTYMIVKGERVPVEYVKWPITLPSGGKFTVGMVIGKL